MSELFPTIDRTARWVLRRRAESYTDAICFGNSFPAVLSVGARSDAQESGTFTPAFFVVDNILRRRQGESYSEGGFLPDFEAELGMRHYLKTDSSLKADEDEIQGYVDSLALFLAVSALALMDYRNPTSAVQAEVSALHAWPEFSKLSSVQQAKAHNFVVKHASWAVETICEKDIVDGKHFMNEVVTLSKNEPHSSSYRLGVRTARDTLALFVDFVNAVLAGQV